MAIPFPLAEFICAEHRYRPLPQRVLLLGRQTVTFGADGLMRLARRFGLPLDPATIERDTTTSYARHRPNEEFVTDTSFFRMLGATEIDAIDHSEFEGANIIHDLSTPVPETLHGRFDFIFNGSVLDNIWDPAAVLRNVSRLAGNSGRVIHVETATPTPYSYVALSPSWYFDYYVANRWADCRVYIAAVPTLAELTSGRWAVMAFDPSAEARPNAFSPSLGNSVGISIVLAESGPGATAGASMAQSHYRSDADWVAFLDRVEPVRTSPRPIHLGEGGTGAPIASHRNVWLSCGWWG
jgi:SAM-dependent methyltransferase